VRDIAELVAAAMVMERETETRREGNSAEDTEGTESTETRFGMNSVLSVSSVVYLLYSGFAALFFLL
jgi:hypothetical protein